MQHMFLFGKVIALTMFNKTFLFLPFSVLNFNYNFA